MPTGPTTPPRLDRIPRRADAFVVPRPIEGETGRVLVDATWGKIRPIELAPGVRTIGELELIAHIEHGLPLIDSRPPDYFAASTIPTAVNIPHGELPGRAGEFDSSVESVLFCNGPQCSATPDSVEKLLAAGYPAERLVYYRGGMHDWVTLGLPTVVPAGD